MGRWEGDRGRRLGWAGGEEWEGEVGVILFFSSLFMII